MELVEVEEIASGRTKEEPADEVLRSEEVPLEETLEEMERSDELFWTGEAERDEEKTDEAFLR